MPGKRKERPMQTMLPFSPVRNSGFLSEHWLEHRLKLEPEWTKARHDADKALTRLLDLWGEQRSRVERYGDEAGLEQAFIQPVLQALGWKIKYQTYLDRREPDYALFENDAKLDAALEAGRKSLGFWKHPTLLADAKAWHVSLDRPTRIGSKREYPPEQIEWYLDRSRLDFAILTNGKLWRLIPREREPGKPRFETYLEVDLPRLLDEWSRRQRTFDPVEFDDFFRFFLFFRPGAFHPAKDRLPLIRRAIQGSSEYCLAVGEDLKERVFEALRLCIEGFLAYSPNALSPDSDLELCREQSFIFLYRLLFVMYAEDRALLPYRVNRTYTNNRSLARHRDEIATRLDRIGDGDVSPYADTSTGIWDSLTDLFDLIDHGHGRYGVPAYNGGLFDSSRYEFLTTKRLPDSYLAEVIDQLGRAPDQAHRDAGLVRVDYRDLAIQHLGSVYEGLLEVHPRYATMPMVVVRKKTREKKTERIQPESRRVPAGFKATETRYEADSVYLQTDKGERRSFGSYYTPDHIVDCIVRHALGPICEEIDRGLNKEIADTKAKVTRSRGRSRTAWQKKLEALRNNFDDRVLALRVLDPAMGSGHFLVRACRYLAEEIATNPHTGDHEADQIEGDEPTLTYWKRRVVESSIFGVDINQMAVELAKLALWLETVSADQPLSFLDHHFRAGNSLVGGRVSELGALPDPTPLLRNTFRDQLQQRLPVLLQPLSAIRAMPSNDAQQIKEKEKLYREAFQPVREAFQTVADLWTSSFFADRADQPTPEGYAEALGSLQGHRKTNKLLQAERYRTALASVRTREVACFHWELEFPEVFFDKAGRHGEEGFDAIIGNPPYDVLAEKELGRDLSSLKAFIEYEDLYTPSRKGKNNLYKLFICRALDLLREGGRLSFIVPMALLGDEQASNVRRAIVNQGAFTMIHAFPQKDDPKRRVFKDAKLSTAVFGMVKTQDETVRARPFESQVHPANVIEPASPKLTLSTQTIPSYDPSNFTIVSCSQEDWDLAVRIMASGRLGRLGTSCESFQGEVNETNERQRGAIGKTPTDGPMALRGANICMYVVREASQGDPVYVKEATFKSGKAQSSKAFHTTESRVGFQRSSPQNNFRRIIASPIRKDSYCVDTVSYILRSRSSYPLPVVLALLNSKLLDWYFRLGSTNSKVNEYQFNNLPFPELATQSNATDKTVCQAARQSLDANDLERVFDLLSPCMSSAPFNRAIVDILEALAHRIATIEQGRGKIARAQRSALDPEAQPYQDLIDRLVYAMAGLTVDEIQGLEDRLARML